MRPDTYKPTIVKYKGYQSEDDEYRIYYESEVFNGEVGDTKVILAGPEYDITLCWINGSEIEAFNNGFKKLLEDHKI